MEVYVYAAVRVRFTFEATPSASHVALGSVANVTERSHRCTEIVLAKFTLTRKEDGSRNDAIIRRRTVSSTTR